MNPIVIGQVMATTGQLAAVTHSGYQAMDHLRSTLLKSSLYDSATLDDVVQCCLGELPHLLAFEYFSVYLLDRLGRLVQVGSKHIWGPHFPSPHPILDGNDWASMLGSPSDNDNYFTVSIFNQEDISLADPLRLAFAELDRLLTYVVRIPLNGSTRTFGFIEAANRVGIQEEPGTLGGDRDIRRFLFIASMLASSITTWRARSESFALSAVTQVLAHSVLVTDTSDLDLQTVFSNALAAGLSRLRDYRAAVLHTESDNRLKLLARSADPNISWDEWRDVEIETGNYLAGQVYLTGKAKVVPVIEDEPSLFVNLKWVQRWALKSCVCLPLTFSTRVVGTFSVFTGFRYDITDLDRSLLLTLADSLALFWGLRQSGESLRQQLNDFHEQRVTDARVGAVKPLTSLLHQAKNDFVKIRDLLTREGDRADYKTASRIAESARKALEKAVGEVTGPEAFEVKAAISNIVRGRRIGKSGNPRLHVDVEDIPPIRMPLSLFNEIVNNVLSNAERAIRRANRRQGTIDLYVGVESGKREDDLVIRVVDNGIGIPRDKFDLIFEKEYTEFADMGGTGMGLFLCREITADYGGTAFVESSRTGQGSTIVARIPLEWIRA